MDRDREGALLVTSSPLKDIIHERKVEKMNMADRKRQRDLQRIRDMHSTEGMNPLQLFPKEIWKQIFSMLGPKDRGNVFHVHQAFCDLMSEASIRDILFPQVLKVANFSFDKCRDLRGVSKCMKVAVDSWIDRKLLREIRELEPHTTSYCVELNINFNDSGEMEGMGNGETSLREMVTSCWNENVTIAETFFPRSFLIYIRGFQSTAVSNETFIRIKDDITTLLQFVGYKIWHFDFSVMIKPRSEPSEEIYIMFRNWVYLMPNLKWLEFEGVGMKVEDNHLDLPFPRLLFLEKLTFHIHTDGNDLLRVYETVLRANLHVEILEFEAFALTDGTISQFFTSDAIKPLQLQRLDVGYSYHCSSLVLRIEDVILPNLNSNWQLNAISLHSVNVNGSLNTLFRFLEHFPTLESVKLHHVMNIRIDRNVSFLMLPNLTRFSLCLNVEESEIDYANSGSSIHFFFSLQFLLYCKKLTKLVWQLRLNNANKLQRLLVRYECHERMINFRGGFRNVYYSNVWNVFPQLNKVSFDCYASTTMKYESREYRRSELSDMNALV